MASMKYYKITSRLAIIFILLLNFKYLLETMFLLIFSQLALFAPVTLACYYCWLFAYYCRLIFKDDLVKAPRFLGFNFVNWSQMGRYVLELLLLLLLAYNLYLMTSSELPSYFRLSISSTKELFLPYGLYPFLTNTVILWAIIFWRNHQLK